MGFSPKQRRALARDVKSCFVRTRQLPEGRELSYIEGWHAVSEANRIFGFDGWNRETVESRCVVGREARGQFQAVYIAKVRVTVRANEHLIVREGYGTGEALAVTLGEAHERAIKTAETDATKRALATFGKPFGLALYGGSKGQLPQSQPRRPEIVRRRTAQTLSRSGRYQVAPRPMPNPSHATTMLAQLDHAESGGPSDATAGESVAPEPLPLAGHPAEEPVDDEPQLVDDGLLIERPRRRRDADHLRFVANQPCLICSRIPSDAHHLKFVQPQALSKKVSDEYTVPLCRIHHRQLHHSGDEVAWWIGMDIDPLPISKDLWCQSRSK